LLTFQEHSLDTNGCSKSQEVKINHLEEVKEETKAFNEENFLNTLKDKNVASQKGFWKCSTLPLEELQ
jgi:hypothetical protein